MRTMMCRALERPYPLEQTVKEWFSRNTESLSKAALLPTDTEQEAEFTREQYLDAAEPVVAAAASWQDDLGRIIDPYEGCESPTSTARFVGAAASLIAAGRCGGLLPQLEAAFDWCAEEMARGHGAERRLQSADFFTKELAWAYDRIAPFVSETKRRQWQQSLAGCSPEGLYTDLIERVGKVDNWNVYALVGEYFRRRHGLYDPSSSLEFVERYLPLQLDHFTAYGMYRDPDDPMTYDLTVRQNLSLLLDTGYDGPYKAAIGEVLRRGALTMLWTVAPNALAPYGGRSNQYHHMEGMIACIAEFEAKRYAVAGDQLMAGIFKRLARRAVASTLPWWNLHPFRHQKNRFDPVTRHGQDNSGQYSVYGLLAVDLYGVAYHMADESIDAAGAFPSEVGGYAIHLPNAFHKVFATAGGYHLQIDTQANLNHDATGWGRLMKAGAPAELALLSPLCGAPAYYSAFPDATRYAAIGPVWRGVAEGRWSSMAEQEGTIATFAFEEDGRSADWTSFTCVWEGSMSGCERVIQRYVVDRGGVTVLCSVQGPTPGQMGYIVPLLISDGGEVSSISSEGNAFVLRRGGWTYRVSCLTPDAKARFLPGESAWLRERGANRNGVYALGLFEGPEFNYNLKQEMRLHLSIDQG